jgi:hypothetical protein
MNDSIKGIRTALQAAPETAEGQTEDAQDGDADTPHDENAASAGTGTGQDASVVEKAVDAVADDDTDEVGYLLAVQVHRFASLMPLGVHAKTKPRVRLHVLARMHACARTLSRHIMVLKCTDVGSAGDVVRLYAPPRPAEDAAAEDQVEGAQGPAAGDTTVAESKDKSKADDAPGQDEVCLRLSVCLCLYSYSHL